MMPKGGQIKLPNFYHNPVIIEHQLQQTVTQQKWQMKYGASNMVNTDINNIIYFHMNRQETSKTRYFAFFEHS